MIVMRNVINMLPTFVLAWLEKCICTLSNAFPLLLHQVFIPFDLSELKEEEMRARRCLRPIISQFKPK